MHSDPALHPAVVLLGAPGAGKGTVARQLEAEHGYCHVDMGEVLRRRAGRGDALGNRIAIAQARGIMVPREVVLGALTAHLSALRPGSRLVLDGFPRTTGQVAAADDGRVPVRITLAIWLDVPAEVAAGRLRSRSSLESRVDDTHHVIETRLGLVRETVDGVRTLFERRGILECVDAQGSPAEVYERVSACILPEWSMA
jgi:adenylate kinase